MDLKTPETIKLKDPGECGSLDEIRKEIDAIDKKIIALFSERHRYVEEIVRFKHDEVSVVAGERKEHVITERRKWAEMNGLDADTFEKIYTILIESNIRHELEILKSRKKG